MSKKRESLSRERDRLHAPAVAEIQKLQADVDEARMCVEVATGEAQRSSGIALGEFAKIMGNEQQGAPWLRRDGDRVLDPHQRVLAIDLGLSLGQKRAA